MSTDDLKALLHRYVDEVWRNQNLEAIDEFLAPTYLRYLGVAEEPLSRSGQKQLLRALHEAFPDAELSILDVVAERDVIAFRSMIQATHLGTFRGIAPTGKRITVRLLDMIRVEAGQFVEQWGGPDMLDLLRQLDARLET